MHTRSKGSNNLQNLSNQELSKTIRNNIKEAREARAATMAGRNEQQEQGAGNLFNQNPVDQIDPPLPDARAGQNQQGNNQQVPPPAPQLPPAVIYQPRRRVTLEEQDTPYANYRNRAAIVPPAIQRQDYEIKPQIIALVKQNQYHGLSSENPLDHIETFEDICSTTSSNGVPQDYLRCKLFAFSLSDKAHRWLKSMRPGSLTSWEECRSAFLAHFFTKARSAALKNKIATFQQDATESFYEAWDRFKEYLRDCPHQSYTESDRMDFFYNGIESRYQMALDTASRGNFMSNTFEEAVELIESLAASNANHCPDYDRRQRGTANNKTIDELSAKVDLLLKAQRRPMNMCEEQEYQDNGIHELAEDTEEVNYIGGQGNFQNRGFNQNYRNHPNLSYRSNNVENPADQVYPPRQQGQYNVKPFTSSQPQQNFSQAPQNKNAGYSNQGFQSNQQGNAGSQDRIEQMFQQMMNGQKQFSVEINAKIDGIYGELNGKIENLSTHMKVLEKQVAQNAAMVKAPPGTLPGKSEINPREFTQVVRLRSGREFFPPYTGIDRSNQIDRSIIVISDDESEPEEDPKDEESDCPSDHSLDDEIEQYLAEEEAELDRQDKIDGSDLANRYEMDLDEDRPIPSRIDRSDGGIAEPEPDNDRPIPSWIDRSDEAATDSWSDEDRPIPSWIDRSAESVGSNIPTKQYISIKGLKVPTGNKAPPLSEPTKAAVSDRVALIAKEMRVRLPFRELKTMVPLLSEHVRKVLTGTSTMDDATAFLQQECNKLMHDKFPTKREDPGRFAIPCIIGDYRFKECIVDLGASVNLMPLSVSRNLGLRHFKPTNVELVMADGSVRLPIGCLINIPILVGGCYILTDFVVLELDDNGAELILGRPFLATASVSINVPQGEVTLRLPKSEMTFYIDGLNKLPTIDGQTFMVDDSKVIDAVHLMEIDPGIIPEDMDLQDGSAMDEDDCIDQVLEAIITPEHQYHGDRPPEKERSIPLMDPAQA